jgi:hypothetical protein
MSKIIQIRWKEVTFPPICVVCTRYARKVVLVEKTFLYKRHTVEIKLHVPLCETHEAYSNPESRFYKPSEALAIRNSVSITKFLLHKDILELTFSNELIADRVARENAANLLTPLPSQALYPILAHILCHDVRLNTWLETSMLSDHFPTEEEARQVVYPQVNPLLAKNSCDGCFYELLDTLII